MLKRNKDTLTAKINRMTEFYESDELDDFENFLDLRSYDVEIGWTFLDMQTRVDYFTTNGRPTRIYEYMERLEQFIESDREI